MTPSHSKAAGNKHYAKVMPWHMESGPLCAPLLWGLWSTYFYPMLYTVLHRQRSVNPDSIPWGSPPPDCSMNLSTNCTIVSYYYLYVSPDWFQEFPQLHSHTRRQNRFPRWCIAHRLASLPCMPGWYVSSYPHQLHIWNWSIPAHSPATRLWKNDDSASLFHIYPASLHSLWPKRVLTISIYLKKRQDGYFNK